MKSLMAFFVLVVAAISLSATPVVFAQEQHYTCPMHPHYIASDPGTCPICGMDLVPMVTGEADADMAAEGHERMTVRVPAETIQTMGVRIAPAEQALFGRQVRSFAAVTPDERARHVVSSRVAGWIEALDIRAVGDPVAPGDRLFTLYSPELVSAQQDYFAARAAGGRRADAAERRLRSLGVQPEVMARLRTRSEALQAIPVYAQAAGRVWDIAVAEGQYAGPGAAIMTVQDYSQVWLIVSVSEQDLPFLREGTPAQVTLPARPGETLSLAVDYIYPTVDSRTRTGQVRLIAPNPDGTLRPGAFADVIFEADQARRLSVPSEAVLMDGTGSWIVVSLGEGRFQPRRIETGLTAGGRTEILTGVDAGEMVVVSGQFLIDSESSLRESFRRLQHAALPLALITLSQSEQAVVDHVVDAALYLHEALVDGFDIQPGFLDPALDAARHIEERWAQTRLAAVMEAARSPLQAAQQARTESGLQDALASLVRTLDPWLMEGRPEHYREAGLVYLTDDESGRSWLQLGATPRNPFGSGPVQATPWPDLSPRRADAEDARTRETPERPDAGHVH